MFERPAEEPSKEEQLRKELEGLEQRRMEINFNIEHREKDSYLSKPSDADILAEVNERIAAVKRELGEPEEVSEKDEGSREKAA